MAIENLVYQSTKLTLPQTWKESDLGDCKTMLYKVQNQNFLDGTSLDGMSLGGTSLDGMSLGGMSLDDTSQ